MPIAFVFVLVFGIVLLGFLFLKGRLKTLKEAEIIDRWSVLIEGANGKGEEIFRKTEEDLKRINAPNVILEKKEVSPGIVKGLLGKKRVFLRAKNDYLVGYLMYIGARDYGEQLMVCWYLTGKAGIWKLLTKKRGSVLPGQMDIFDLEELTAYVTTVHHALMDAAKEVSETVGFDFTKVDQKSRGFLNIS